MVPPSPGEGLTQACYPWNRSGRHPRSRAGRCVVRLGRAYHRGTARGDRTGGDMGRIAIAMMMVMLGGAFSSPSRVAAPSPTPVVLIVMENHGYGQIV